MTEQTATAARFAIAETGWSYMVTASPLFTTYGTVPADTPMFVRRDQATQHYLIRWTDGVTFDEVADRVTSSTAHAVLA